eukprot:CAMPEP_0172527018 /NCGR_PEP_ID=MMETSP1067-20121228/1815_1 /TAXON_ID=265564 ORGANISM="Thalassiosira punctigera, Strain Tpunct2005C2" /NCGR_SAMPLE_ID=MMETSP1067 /ASSEMBLY_ACC=CAM_ASM_000444 /LENGTH=809 /DNA_ID=CAMNT_0013310675 /DNA_START=233 /DNA_END=2662 /DNA_ORIENTATION=+
MTPAPELRVCQSPLPPTADGAARDVKQLQQNVNHAPFSSAERATLDALTATLRSCNAHLGGSAIGKGFRLAARYHLHKRAPHSLPLIGSLSLAGDCDAGTASSNRAQWDASALEPGVQHTIEDPFYVVDLGVVSAQLARWRAAFPRVVPYYAVKCNPDPAIVRTLMCLGCNFDCASRAEIELVQNISFALPGDFPRPEIVYANPTKARGHIIDAVCRGVRMMTFDNVVEVRKCAAVSRKIQLVMRIITDDSGSQCRLSSKFGAPPQHWPILLAEAKRCGLEVVGVSFHVGSGCRDATRYEMALKDCKKIFEMADRDFGYKMTVLDIGGGFPGETHSMWNPAKAFGDPTAAERDPPPKKLSGMEEIPSISEGGDEADDKNKDDIDDDDDPEGKDPSEESSAQEEKERQYMYFNEIALAVAPMLDEMFPPSSGVRIIAEPGRYLVAAAATLVASIVSVRNNRTDDSVPVQAISDKAASDNVFLVTRAEEDEIVQGHARVLEQEENPIIETLVEELADYSQRFARANLSQQEVDVYLDNVTAHATEDAMATAPEMEPGKPCTEDGTELTHTVEGMQAGIVVGCADKFDDDASAITGMRSRAQSFDGSLGGNTNRSDSVGLDIPCVLAAAGEAAVSGIVRQAIADSAQPLQDDFAYYINDGVYGAFNNLLFDHATVRPRKLRNALSPKHQIVVEGVRHGEGEDALRIIQVVEEEKVSPSEDESLYPSTVFGPTCDSMDVLSRGVLLPKMDVGDWMYFQNMGAYTSAAASTFNGFPTTEKFYVCSVPPRDFAGLVAEGRVVADSAVCTKEGETK